MPYDPLRFPQVSPQLSSLQGELLPQTPPPYSRYDPSRSPIRYFFAQVGRAAHRFAERVENTRNQIISALRNDREARANLMTGGPGGRKRSMSFIEENRDGDTHSLTGSIYASTQFFQKCDKKIEELEAKIFSLQRQINKQVAACKKLKQACLSSEERWKKTEAQLLNKNTVPAMLSMVKRTINAHDAYRKEVLAQDVRGTCKRSGWGKRADSLSIRGLEFLRWGRELAARRAVSSVAKVFDEKVLNQRGWEKSLSCYLENNNDKLLKITQQLNSYSDAIVGAKVSLFNRANQNEMEKLWEIANNVEAALNHMIPQLSKQLDDTKTGVAIIEKEGKTEQAKAVLPVVSLEWGESQRYLAEHLSRINFGDNDTIRAFDDALSSQYMCGIMQRCFVQTTAKNTLTSVEKFQVLRHVVREKRRSIDKANGVSQSPNSLSIFASLGSNDQSCRVYKKRSPLNSVSYLFYKRIEFWFRYFFKMDRDYDKRQDRLIDQRDNFEAAIDELLLNNQIDDASPISKMLEDAEQFEQAQHWYRQELKFYGKYLEDDEEWEKNLRHMLRTKLVREYAPSSLAMILVNLQRLIDQGSSKEKGMQYKKSPIIAHIPILRFFYLKNKNIYASFRYALRTDDPEFRIKSRERFLGFLAVIQESRVHNPTKFLSQIVNSTITPNDHHYHYGFDNIRPFLEDIRHLICSEVVPEENALNIFPTFSFNPQIYVSEWKTVERTNGEVFIKVVLKHGAKLEQFLKRRWEGVGESHIIRYAEIIRGLVEAAEQSECYPHLFVHGVPWDRLWSFTPLSEFELKDTGVSEQGGATDAVSPTHALASKKSKPTTRWQRAKTWIGTKFGRLLGRVRAPLYK